MQIENKYELVTVRYKNLDEYIKEQGEYINNSWVVVSESVDSDLSMVVEYKRLVSGKVFDTLRTLIQSQHIGVIRVIRGAEIEYTGSAEELLKSKLISDKQLLRCRVRNSTVVDGILRVEV